MRERRSRTGCDSSAPSRWRLLQTRCYDRVKPVPAVTWLIVAGLALSVRAAAGQPENAVAEDAPYGLTTRPPCDAFLRMPPNDRGPIPALLSQTGAFKDVRALAPADGLIPYDLNVSFWSDGASKLRWVAVPDGARIGFSPTGEWTFPAGTTFVKHFEIRTDETRNAAPRRLETRLLVRDDAGGVYGASYRWQDDNSDADLVREPRAESVQVNTRTGPRTQSWYFPGPRDCRVCHNPVAGYVLGPKTRQLNRPFTYSPTGRSDNQLRTWNHLGLFDPPLDEAEVGTYARLAPPDDARASIECRARSYLDANCSHCHRPGGVAGNFDARFDTPLARQNLIDGPVLISLGIDGARLVAPRDPWRSVVLARLLTLEQPKMPPLAHERIDEQGADLIRQWVQSLPGPPVLAPPVIEPKGGEFKGPVKVTLRHADPAAVIRYTLDGRVPGKSATICRGPIELTAPATLRAAAFKDGATRSITVQETFVVGE